MFWGTNCLGVCKGNVISNGVISSHYFDVLIALDENDTIKAYLFDTQFNTEPTLLTDTLVSTNNISWVVNTIRI
jgi:hypothetical protein